MGHNTSSIQFDAMGPSPFERRPSDVCLHQRNVQPDVIWKGYSCMILRGGYFWHRISLTWCTIWSRQSDAIEPTQFRRAFHETLGYYKENIYRNPELRFADAFNYLPWLDCFLCTGNSAARLRSSSTSRTRYVVRDYGIRHGGSWDGISAWGFG
jgi:hypothetical protein